MTTLSEPCVDVPCVCGRCYTPGSVVGEWLRRAGWRVRLAFETRVLRRRRRHDACGGLLVPDWVIRAFED